MVMCASTTAIGGLWGENSAMRKASVDENYEWDAADLCSQPGDHDETPPPSLNPLKPAPCCSLPRMQRSTKARTNCSQPSLLLGHQSSCSAEPEPDTTLISHGSIHSMTPLQQRLCTRTVVNTLSGASEVVKRLVGGQVDNSYCGDFYGSKASRSEDEDIVGGNLD
ncbi:hypothetical protein EYF80_043425 [Liparis tanakae]|uniref:Uncharacterized protein n=1 Tax=Liparis tanakae TaxID=230148 RepID=A0A4Z2G1J6_9TELE|nr:hypothetical protein EYF80_043425 [Liparis tanakae]